MLRPEVVIYTDGSFFGRNGNGGWAAHLQCNGQNVTICGCELDTTNNRMEIMAVLAGLRALIVPCKVVVYSDSQYVVNSISQGWLRGWVRKGWITSTGGQVKNRDLWEEMLTLLDIHDVHAQWVRGHNGDPLNELCDSISRCLAVDPNRFI